MNTPPVSTPAIITAGFVVGLPAEARFLRGCGPIAIGGGTPEGAERAAESLVADGARALISFGLAGGLDPTLRPGTLVIPRAVWAAGNLYPTSPTLTAHIAPPNATVLAATPAIIATAAAKAALHATSHAAAVDLESGAAARVATRHSIPFAVLRAICDPATRTLPHTALIALDAHGAIGLTRILASLLRYPQDLPTLLHLALDAAAARSTLRRTANLLRSKQGSAGSGPRP